MHLSALLKVKRGVYAAVPDEICIAFKNATIEQIRQNRDMVLLNNDAVVIKLRLPDKKQHLSKADGYRLIYLVLKEKSVVILLDVYPKRGPSQQLDIDDNEIARLVEEFYVELDSGVLVAHDINDRLKEIN
jgi:mRNA-degrading endonuclease RelE of RelBE toxin-antitoxin system